MKKFNLTIISIALFLLAACGGGSGGSGSSPSPSPTPAPPAAPSPPPQSAPTETADLVVSPSFTLATYQMIEVNVDVSSRWNGKLFLNICETTGESDPRLNFNKCLLNAPLQNGKLNTSVSVSYGVNRLGAEIIDSADLDLTETHYFTKGDFSNSLSITLQ